MAHASSHQRHIRDQFFAFLPLGGKRAFFHAQIVIHDLINVPLVYGDFAVKWRIQNAHSISQSARSSNGKQHKAKEEETSSGTVEEGSEQDSLHDSQKQSRSSSSGDSSQQYAYNSQYNGANAYGQYLTPEPTPIRPDVDESVHIPEDFVSAAKGRTEYRPLLYDHSVSFEQRIDVDVEMSVDKDTSDLGSCELRLDVLQDVPTIDNERDKQLLGVVYINLAEYAGAGLVTRKHLLRKCKVNAVAKVTISLKQYDGERDFRA